MKEVLDEMVENLIEEYLEGEPITMSVVGRALLDAGLNDTPHLVYVRERLKAEGIKITIGER